jgi:hypothetical protein
LLRLENPRFFANPPGNRGVAGHSRAKYELRLEKAIGTKGN